MTTDVATTAPPYDPDDAPELPRNFVGKLVESVYVEDQAHADRLGPTLSENYRRYADKVSSRTLGPCWMLRAEGISVVRSDGQPFIQSEILPLTGKDGRWLGKGQAPSVLGGAYTTLGVSASYVKVGQPDSALGRTFFFEEHEVKFGPYSKTFRLWPAELYPDGYVYAGEVRVVTPRSEGATGDAPAEPIAAGLSEQEAVLTLLRILVDQPVESAFDLIMAEPSLKATGKVLGVALLEAATDGSLAAVLQENGVLVVDGDNIFRMGVPTATPVTNITNLTPHLVPVGSPA